MGILKHSRSGLKHVLLARHLVGRGGFCPLRLQDRYSSQEHAVFWFADGRWWIRDLDSRNGTWLDSSRLEPNQANALSVGSVVAFGNPKQEWEIVDLSPPGPVAEALLTGNLVAGDETLLLLPSDENPEVAVYSDGQGGWLMERDEAIEAIADHARIEVAGDPWRLLLPVAATATWESRDPEAGWQLHFRVSADEEYVECDVEREARKVSLRPRAHTFLMLTLARRRLEDDLATEPERGWVYVDELCRMLRVDRRTLNVHVFRARKQISDSGLGNPASLVDRRTSTDQVRLGIAEITVGRI